MQRNIKWANEIERVKQLESDGYNMVDIAAHYGVSRQCIFQIFKKYEIVRVGVESKRATKRKAYELKWGDRTDILWKEKKRRFNQKKANAKIVGTEFTIEFGDLYFPDTCPILGIPLNYFASTREEASPSFDRIDPTLGYIKDNVIVCSWRANRIKNDGNAEEHRLIADYLTKHVI